ncbi:flagellar motor switch protein FliM [Tepidiforma sp.]|uniref:flagellar motor switch protein FliM n=1 Tax=Tepidiforma sp. TaxID=2682230 RepID=UPI002ADD74C6|nr:FliM/FliN family flagellar motor switch protein [Tepidiforma sp.]
MASENAVLTQREIDALLSADVSQLDADTIVTLPPPSRKDSGTRRVKPYDFRHPEKLSKEQLRGLQIIQQGVASSMAANFSARLRAPVESRLSALERGIYEEYVSQLGTQSVVVIIDMSPLQGYSVAAFGLDVAFGIIDRLLGGKGKRAPRVLNRDLTDIEIALIRHIGMDIARSLIEPWARIVELTPDVSELALGPQVMHAIPPSEFVITAWYEIRLAEQTGGISLCFPLTILEQILPKLTGQSLFDNRPGRGSREHERVREDQLRPMKVVVRARLGSAWVEATDLAQLAPGDVIVLDQPVDEPLRVMVGNCERFAGFPGTHGRKLALQVEGLIDDDGWVRPFEEPADG